MQRSMGQIRPIRAAYAGTVAIFLWAMGQFYIPNLGFTYLLGFGSAQESQHINKLRRLDYYVARQSDGYDAQYYVQMAFDPSLTNRQLKQAVDSLPYRGRRILMSATAYALGMGQPVWIIQWFALLNIFCWLALAGVLLHWFPPHSGNNFLRWSGILFSCGLCISVRNALLDGPSLLLIASGLMLLEKGRPWLATAVLALSGLGKETNLFGAACFLPQKSEGSRAWLLAGLRGLLIAAPLVLWMTYLSIVVGPATGLGVHNFALPFAAYVNKWREVMVSWPTLTHDFYGPVYSVFMLVTLSVQFLYLLLCPQWQKAAWRVGATFALLMIFLGDAVWEGYPGAGTRVLLPMQLAFNLLVPVGRRWLPLLLVGNLSMLIAPYLLQPPPGPRGVGYELNGSLSILTTNQGKAVTVKFSPEWYGTESDTDSNYWTWTSGNAEITILNPHAAPLQTKLHFDLSAIGRRNVSLRLGGVEIWQTTVPAVSEVSVKLRGVLLRPGLNRLEFVTDTVADKVGHDPRTLAFCLRNFRIDLQQLQPTAPPVP